VLKCFTKKECPHDGRLTFTMLLHSVYYMEMEVRRCSNLAKPAADPT